jgi:hypothetical protein
MVPELISPMIFKNRDKAFENYKAAGHPVKEQGVVVAQLPISRGRDASVPKDFAAKFLAELLVNAKGCQGSQGFTVGGDVHACILCNQ